MVDTPYISAGLNESLQESAREMDAARTALGNDVVNRENRIEALRAASRVVGGTYSDYLARHLKEGGKVAEAESCPAATLKLAEKFVRYIEKGER